MTTRHLSCTLAALALLLLASCFGGDDPVPVGPTADELVAEGQTALLAGDGTTAADKFAEALDAEAGHDQANFGMGLTDLLKVANDVVVFLAATNEAPFKNVTNLKLADPPVPSVGGQPLTTSFKGGSLIDTDLGSIEIDDMTGTELHNLLLTAVNGVDSAVAHFSAALDSGSETFTFQVPLDWNNGAAGSVTLSRADMLTLLGGLQLVSGQLHLAAAFDISALSIQGGELVGAGGEGSPQDSDSNGFFDVGELAEGAGIPASLGTLVGDGDAHLTKMVGNNAAGATNLLAAGDIYAAGNELLGHWAFNLDAAGVADFQSNWGGAERVRLQFFADAFESNATLNESNINLIIPAAFVDSGFTQQVSLGSFFTGLPDDLRDVPLQFVEDEFSGEPTLPVEVSDAITDGTLLGLFPGGLSQANYEALFGVSGGEGF